jgi:hypothetical protein
LEQSGAKSWRDALSVVQEYDVERKNVLQAIAASNVQIAESIANATTGSQGLSGEQAQQILKHCSKVNKKLVRLEIAWDEEREFLAEYSLKQLERRVHMENSLDAQYDKLRARLVMEQEARILRDKLRKSQDSTTVPSHDNIEEGGVSNSANEGAPASERAVRDFFDELGRDDDDTDEWGEPKATG